MLAIDDRLTLANLAAGKQDPDIRSRESSRLEAEHPAQRQVPPRRRAGGAEIHQPVDAAKLPLPARLLIAQVLKKTDAMHHGLPLARVLHGWRTSASRPAAMTSLNHRGRAALMTSSWTGWDAGADRARACGRGRRMLVLSERHGRAAPRSRSRARSNREMCGTKTPAVLEQQMGRARSRDIRGRRRRVRSGVRSDVVSRRTQAPKLERTVLVNSKRPHVSDLRQARAMGRVPGERRCRMRARRRQATLVGERKAA